MTMNEPVKLTSTGRPQVIEFSADATGVGKTTAALRLRYHCEQRDIKTVLVTIESRGVAATRASRPADVFIATEDFRRAKEMPGGLVGVLRPLYGAIEQAAKTGAAVIIDWAGGHAQSRIEALAATQFDQRLTEFRMVGVSVIVTTSSTDKMRQAATNLLRTQEVVPGLQRVLLLNARNGSFDFIPGTAPATAYKNLMKAAQGGKLIRFPAIEGESWQECDQAGLTMPAVIRATPAHIAGRTKLDTFTAAACISEVAAWWALTEKSLAAVFPFRAEPIASV
jgi:hypothetical protein